MYVATNSQQWRQRNDFSAQDMDVLVQPMTVQFANLSAAVQRGSAANVLSEVQLISEANFLSLWVQLGSAANFLSWWEQPGSAANVNTEVQLIVQPMTCEKCSS